MIGVTDFSCTDITPGIEKARYSILVEPLCGG